MRSAKVRNFAYWGSVETLSRFLSSEYLAKILKIVTPTPLKILPTTTAEAAPWASCVFESCY